MINTRPLLKGLVVWGLVAGFVILSGTDSDARRRSRKDRASRTSVIRLQRVAPEVATVPFGQELDQVVNWARIRLEGRYLPRMKSALDMHERAAIQMEFDREVQKVRSGLVPADGTRTGFEVSVVAGQFAPGVGESVLLFRSGATEHYFFFTEGILWKYARPLAANTPYETRLADYERDHGDATAKKKAPSGREALWRGKEIELQLIERRRVFRSDLVVVTARSQLKTVKRRRGSTKKPVEESVNPELHDFIDTTGAADE